MTILPMKVERKRGVTIGHVKFLSLGFQKALLLNISSLEGKGKEYEIYFYKPHIDKLEAEKQIKCNWALKNLPLNFYWIYEYVERGRIKIRYLLFSKIVSKEKYLELVNKKIIKNKYVEISFVEKANDLQYLTKSQLIKNL